jgi:hypothetical protein
LIWRLEVRRLEKAGQATIAAVLQMAERDIDGVPTERNKLVSEDPAVLRGHFAVRLTNARSRRAESKASLVLMSY